MTLERTRAAIDRRTESERMRYLQYYDLDYTDHSRYDLVIDTSEMSVGEVTAAILAEVGEARSG